MVTLEVKPKYTKTTGYSPENALLFAQGVTGWRLSIRQHIWTPPTDVYEMEDKYCVRVEISGMDENDFTVKIDSNRLTISGIRSDLPETRAYHQMEIHFGEFSTSVDLPGLVDIDHVSADYTNGFLRVNLPKAQTKHVDISQ